MPGGGHGTILNIANALNEHKETKESIMSWIDGGYTVVASPDMLGAAFNQCEYKKDLQEIWCHAIAKGRVEQLEY